MVTPWPLRLQSLGWHHLFPGNMGCSCASERLSLLRNWRIDNVPLKHKQTRLCETIWSKDKEKWLETWINFSSWVQTRAESRGVSRPRPALRVEQTVPWRSSTRATAKYTAQYLKTFWKSTVNEKLPAKITYAAYWQHFSGKVRRHWERGRKRPVSSLRQFGI